MQEQTLPGLGATVTSTPGDIYYSKLPNAAEVAVSMDSTARDTSGSHTPTTTLRAGLVLGRITASKKYAQYDPSAVDGTETAVLILTGEVKLLDENAAAQDRPARGCIAGGLVDPDKCYGLDSAARVDLSAIQFSDSVY